MEWVCRWMQTSKSPYLGHVSGSGAVVTRNTMSVMQESLHPGNGHWQNKGTRGERKGGK
jgi:hypothetical protein